MNKPARMSDLPLFAPPAPPEVQAIHGRLEDSHARFLDRLRAIVAGCFAGSGIEISTDNAWELMAKYRVKLPEGASPNLMGSLFSGWERATAVGWKRSKRDGAHGNLIRTWVVK